MAKIPILILPPVRISNDPVTGQQSRHDASLSEAVAPVPPTDVVTALQQQVDALSARVTGQVRLGINMELVGLVPFSPKIRRAVMPAGVKLPTFTMFRGKTDT
ncbi:hypothetical protein LIER_27513 [Lithospermum erythrorhizon]|uniref:Uncharacterized protein n=1 Tax=Lithospermum erythrorhizon TaxID=34254 RepID=A0AAV3REC7_LITER